MFGDEIFGDEIYMVLRFQVLFIRFSHDGRKLASGAKDETVIIWKIDEVQLSNLALTFLFKYQLTFWNRAFEVTNALAFLCYSTNNIFLCYSML